MSATHVSPTLYGRGSEQADGFGAIGAGLKTLFARIKGWNERRATALELEALDDRILADIGLTRGEISQVAAGHYVRSNDAGYKAVSVAAPANAAVTQARAA